MDGLKVLVAEDDKLNRMMICKLMEKFGAECSKAKDGKQAVDMVCDDDFNAVFLDYNMPVYSGAEAADIIRKKCTESGRETPQIVCVSADEENGEDEVFDDFLPKPFRVEKIQEILEKISKGVID